MQSFVSGRKGRAFWESVAIIIGAAIGAGVLGIPYVVAQIGFGVGIAYIVILGLVMLLLNLMTGEIAARTSRASQLTGMAEKYLGKSGKILMAVSVLFGIYGALLAYVIGTGEVLQAMFGGSAFGWSIAFFIVGGIFLYRGLKTVKLAELIMTIILFVVVLAIAFWSAPSIQLTNLNASIAWESLFLPYGVILFAFHGSSSIPVVRTLLAGRQKQFKWAIIFSSVIIIALYAIFALAVVGVTGRSTTEVATVGLGQALGPVMILFGNIFAFFAMGSSFLLLGTALRETYEWDFHLNPTVAWGLTIAGPIVLFLAGIRGFIGTLAVTGSVFTSLTAILIVLMYWRVQKKGDRPAKRFHMHHAVLVSGILLIVFAFAAIYSVWQFFS